MRKMIAEPTIVVLLLASCGRSRRCERGLGASLALDTCEECPEGYSGVAWETFFCVKAKRSLSSLLAHQTPSSPVHCSDSYQYGADTGRKTLTDRRHRSDSIARPARGVAGAHPAAGRHTTAPPNMKLAAVGPVGVLCVGAFLFSTANVLAKIIYSGGTSQTALFVIRAIAVYPLNIFLEAFRNGWASARRVAALRAGPASRLCALRGLCGWVGISLLNLGFMLMHIADAFALVLGVMSVGTVVGARICVGGNEKLTMRALAGNAFALVGLVLVTQPEMLFGQSGAPPLAGVLLCIGSGVMLAAFNILSRVLGRARGDAASSGDASPAMLLSYYLVVIGMCSGAMALLAPAILGPLQPSPAPFTSMSNLTNRNATATNATTSAALPRNEASGPWEWTRFTPPVDTGAWALTACYCVCILVGQIFLAVGYGRLPAGRAAVIALTEIAYTWLLDVSVLREPTNALAACGTFVVFVGCALAATGTTKAPAMSEGRGTTARADNRSLAQADAANTFDESDWVEVVQPATDEDTVQKT